LCTAGEAVVGVPIKRTKEISDTNTLSSLLLYIPPLSTASTKFSSDPKCSEKPLNKGPKILCQTGKSPNGSNKPQMTQKSLQTTRKRKTKA
jgi:hypothetical protein